MRLFGRDGLCSVIGMKCGPTLLLKFALFSVALALVLCFIQLGALEDKHNRIIGDLRQQSTTMGEQALTVERQTVAVASVEARLSARAGKQAECPGKLSRGKESCAKSSAKGRAVRSHLGRYCPICNV